MKEFQEASTGLAAALPAEAPSAHLKDRILLAAAGRPAARPARISRLFWGAAAAALFVILFSALFSRWTSMVLEGASGARLTVRWKDRDVRILGHGLATLPRGKVYQLWHLAPNPVPARTFAPGPDGRVIATDTLKKDVAAGHFFAVTIEPEGGSPSPTMPIQLAPRK